MHHARCPLRISRPGVRTAVSVTKPKLDLGKWALPEQATPGGPAIPNISKWANPQASSSRTTTDGHRGNRQDSFRRQSREVPVENLSKWQIAKSSQFEGQLYPGSQKSGIRSNVALPPGHLGDEPALLERERLRQRTPRTASSLGQGADHPKSFNRPRNGEVKREDTRSKPSRDPYKERGSLVRIGNSSTSEKFRRNDSPRGTQKAKDKKIVRNVHKKVNPDVFIPSVVSVGNLAKLLSVRLERLQRKMVQAGMAKETSYDHILTAEYASLIAMEFGRNPIVNDEAAFDIFSPPAIADLSNVPVRPPIVTIMGHVDHGKTTLLDTLRSASVAAGEAGGITQHIGAFSVDVPNHDSSSSDQHRRITFLDTPGHAAFSSMRSRGASVTDVIVLVVAADDGIMPQTREVLELVKKEGDKVALIIAINKVDKPGVDIDTIEKSLLAEGVQLETFGGDIPVVHVSGLTGQGLPQLVETISLVAEIKDLRAPETGSAQGYILESRIDKGLGPVATVLMIRGSLERGSHLICGTTHCKIRRLTSPGGELITSVGPGSAAVVTGWKEVPSAGDEVLSGTEDEIKRAVTNRLRKASIEATLDDVDSINENLRVEREARESGEGSKASHPQTDDKKELRLLIKADVSGTVEAVAGTLQGIGNHLAGVKIVSSGVGPVTESDVMRAKASEASIVAFSVHIPRAVQVEAAGQQVPIIESNIIYRLMDDVRKEVASLLPPVIETRVTGEATVLQLFDIQGKAKQIVKVAGCRVINGVVDRTKKVRVVRDGKTIHEGNIETLRNQKMVINEAAKGLECGISLENFQDLCQGDLIQIVQDIEKPRTL